MAYLEAETPHRSPSALRLMRDSTMSRKKHDTTPVAEAAELAHGLLGEHKGRSRLRDGADQHPLQDAFEDAAAKVGRRGPRPGRACAGARAAAQRRQRKEHGQRGRAREPPAARGNLAWQRVADEAKKKT